MTTEQVLPVTALIDDVIAWLPQAPVVLEAPPGAGKSTALPLALLQANIYGQRRILLLQPRRLAAISIAHYLAEQLGQQVGDDVGYHIRGAAKFHANTKLLILTEGMFTQYIQRDPELADVGLVIFDEFHERNLASDLGLAMALDAISLRSDLGLLIMSATLPAQQIANRLGHCKVLTSSGRQHPVEVSYHPPSAAQTWLQAMPGVIRQAMQKAQQGVLVFVPGQREINALMAQFNHLEDWQVSALHRNVPQAEQRALFTAKADSKKRLVFATNIAETSVTIPHIDVVVDSGRERQAQFYPQHGITRLVTRRITKASATQRAGRAGRLGPGACLRVWSQNDDHGLRDYQVPELETADLTSFLLECRKWGAEPQQMMFLTPPQSAHLRAAHTLLTELTICQPSGALTSQGRDISQYPTEPRLARMLNAVAHESTATKATAAWLMAQIEQGAASEHFPQPLAHLSPAAKQRFQFWCRQLSVTTATIQPELAASLLLWAFPDRVAQRRGQSDRYLLSYGGGATIHRADTRPRWPWLLAVDLMLSETQADAIIGAALPLSEADLEHPALNIEQRTEVRWQGPQQRLQAVNVTALGAIRLREAPLSNAISAAQRLQALSQYVTEQMSAAGLAWFKLNEQAKQWLARYQLYLDCVRPEGWPSLATDELADTLSEWAEPYWLHIDNLRDLQQWNVVEALQGRLSYAQQQSLAQACPTHVVAPSGRSVAIDYCAQQPTIAIKLQEMFGEPVSPTICHGKVILTIDLLSPAGRLLQRTGDLASFWDNAYEHVKKEMRGRYPKHPWPDDPRQAQATHKTKRHLT